MFKIYNVWVYGAMAFALFNWLIKGYANGVDVMFTCFMITFYFLSRICALLESNST